MSERTLSLYVPNIDSGVNHLIDPRSGIVGVPTVEGHVLIYYEGNRFGYANVRTWADRVLVAAGRCIERYPTVARRVVASESLLHVGSIDYDSKRIFIDNSEALAHWLEVVELGPAFDHEVQFDGVTL